MNSNFQKFKLIWLGLAVIVSIFLGLAFNLFNSVDRWLYDKQMMLPGIETSTSAVVLVEVNQLFQHASTQEWLDILTKIDVLKPKAIVLPAKPVTWTESEKKSALDNFSLFIGDVLSDDKPITDDDERKVLTLLPPIDGDAYRQQWFRYEVGITTYDSIELNLAAELTEFTPATDQSRYYIDFRNARGRIPIVEMQRVIRGELVESLIKDRVILIGYVDALAPELHTPVGIMAFPLYQAYALDTLLKNNEINHLGLVSMMLLSVCLVIAMLLLMPRIADRYQRASLLFLMIITLILSWLLLMFSNLWIQPGVFLIVEFSVFLLLYYESIVQGNIELRKMALKSAFIVEHRWSPKSIYSSEEHWTQIANMVSQTLSLHRTIFLERVEDDHRVKEIKALNCSLDDVNEMRRDYHRAPYTNVVEDGGVLRIDREYLTKSDEPENQYMVALNFAGDIQGFWAFTLKQDHHLDEKKVIYVVEQFALQIAELLFHRSQWLKHQEYQQKTSVRLLSLQSEKSDYTAINQAVNFMAQRLTVMEAVMDGMETSAVLYDLFGRVMQVNAPMSATLSEINLAPYSITATDLISQLTGCSLLDARNYLSYIILDRGTINLPVKHDELDKGFILSVRGLHSKEELEVAEGEVRPFEIIGILCELIDMSRISKVYTQKEKIVEHLSNWLLNDLSSISISCDLMKDDRLDQQKKDSLMVVVKDKTEALANKVKRVNKIIQSDLVTRVSAHFPIDCQTILLEAVDNIRKKNTRIVDIETQLPNYMPLVLASPNELRKIFDDILFLLINDAVEDSKVSVEVRCKTEMLEFSFYNKGFGIPNDHLQTYLENNEVLDSAEFKTLRIIKHQIIDWGGTFDAYSAVGEGMRYTFSLESFQSNE